MNERGLPAALEQALEPVALQHGFELVAVEIAGGAGSPIVRIYLDREGGVDLDAIASADPWLTEALEDQPELSAAYTLEVSSPGIERPLRTRAHFERFIGSQARVKTTRPIHERSSFTGTIVELRADDVVLDCDGTLYEIPVQVIRKANLKYDFDSAHDKGVRR
ncbi:MAG: ribosome maturation factor RimP [Anaerosomatales bacterium]|nr:ribosome maturation factor RimP [Anaerosomatales bacterium]